MKMNGRVLTVALTALLISSYLFYLGKLDSNFLYLVWGIILGYYFGSGHGFMVKRNQIGG